MTRREGDEEINDEELDDPINRAYHEVVDPQDLLLNETTRTLVAACLQQAAWKFVSRDRECTRGNREKDHVLEKQYWPCVSATRREFFLHTLMSVRTASDV